MKSMIAAGTRLGTLGLVDLNSAGYFSVGDDYRAVLDLLEGEGRITPQAMSLLERIEPVRATISVAFVSAGTLAIRRGGASEGSTMWDTCLDDKFLPEWSRDRLDTDHQCRLLSAASWPDLVAKSVMIGCGGICVWCGSKPLALGAEVGCKDGEGWFLFAHMKKGKGKDVAWHLDATRRDVRNPFIADLVALGVVQLH